VLHLAVTRSAAVRLAPVADALGGPQAFVDLAGDVLAWAGTRPPAVDGDPPLSPTAAARAVSEALERIRPDVALVAGDGDVAMACALAAIGAGVPVARLGAGLRCDDRGVRNEINRLAIDGLASRLYADGESAAERLRAEGADEHAIRTVGSTVAAGIARWRRPALARAAWARFGLRRREYVLVNLRRHENFADAPRLTQAIIGLAREAPVVLCLDRWGHAALEQAGDLERLASVVSNVGDTLGYVDFLSLLSGAGAVLTDGGGVQEESTVLGIPCFTLARSSERELTLTHGTNVLLGNDLDAIADVTTRAQLYAVEPIPLWDADAGRRVAADLMLVPWAEE
jgi:UDP-N-acetylglucosamine 2-epimerase (non-hydrolysing)